MIIMIIILNQKKEKMSKIKTYECKICLERVKKGVKNAERFTGIRKAVRDHIKEVHNIKGQKNKMGATKKEFGKSRITQNTLSYENEYDK